MQRTKNDGILSIVTNWNTNSMSSQYSFASSHLLVEGNQGGIKAQLTHFLNLNSQSTKYVCLK